MTLPVRVGASFPELVDKRTVQSATDSTLKAQGSPIPNDTLQTETSSYIHHYHSEVLFNVFDMPASSKKTKSSRTRKGKKTIKQPATQLTAASRAPNATFTTSQPCHDTQDDEDDEAAAGGSHVEQHVPEFTHNEDKGGDVGDGFRGSNDDDTSFYDRLRPVTPLPRSPMQENLPPLGSGASIGWAEAESFDNYPRFPTGYSPDNYCAQSPEYSPIERSSATGTHGLARSPGLSLGGDPSLLRNRFSPARSRSSIRPPLSLPTTPTRAISAAKARESIKPARAGNSTSRAVDGVDDVQVTATGNLKGSKTVLDEHNPFIVPNRPIARTAVQESTEAVEQTPNTDANEVELANDEESPRRDAPLPVRAEGAEVQPAPAVVHSDASARGHADGPALPPFQWDEKDLKDPAHRDDLLMRFILRQPDADEQPASPEGNDVDWRSLDFSPRDHESDHQKDNDNDTGNRDPGVDVGLRNILDIEVSKQDAHKRQPGVRPPRQKKNVKGKNKRQLAEHLDVDQGRVEQGQPSKRQRSSGHHQEALSRMMVHDMCRQDSVTAGNPLSSQPSQSYPRVTPEASQSPFMTDYTTTPWNNVSYAAQSHAGPSTHPYTPTIQPPYANAFSSSRSVSGQSATASSSWGMASAAQPAAPAAFIPPLYSWQTTPYYPPVPTAAPVPQAEDFDLPRRPSTRLEIPPIPQPRFPGPYSPGSRFIKCSWGGHDFECDEHFDLEMPENERRQHVRDHFRRDEKQHCWEKHQTVCQWVPCTIRHSKPDQGFKKESMVKHLVEHASPE
ncbi:hypothetical protein BD626DRAFT_572976 [Schizophyllum amplum]|uniref:Uncharacterized protein n=1 Tax=Schizophyllum amplum TaxID=97359 RepID=A0A550C2X7_9AGAR|nr:hypothetical protein BD626DRAFT_572976 [Auriculariopsis ampla]